MYFYRKPKLAEYYPTSDNKPDKKVEDTSATLVSMLIPYS